MEYVLGGEEKELWFRLPDGVVPHSDLIACSVAAIVGQRATRVEFREPITEPTRKRLEAITRATWQAPTNSAEGPRPGNRTILNFSGGFDSLSALALLGSDQVELVSMDFGQSFRREREFFAEFSPHIVESNVTDFERDWTFMGAGAILLAEELGASRMAFGSILEASAWNMLPGARPSADQAVFQTAGMRGVAPISGLTEFATTTLAAKEFPQQIVRSLRSLADPGSEKYFRKLMMLRHIRPDDTDIQILAGDAYPVRSRPFGSSLAIDFLTPGMLSMCGRTEVERWVDLPRGMQKFVDDRMLDFYSKWNPSVLTSHDPEVRRLLAVTRAEKEIEPYDARDWDEIRDLVRVLRMFHVFPGETW